MARARLGKSCGAQTRLGVPCAAPAIFDGRCRRHGGSGTNARPPWTLVGAPEGLAAFPEHEHPREPHRRRRTRPLLPCAASALVRRGVITRAIVLAGSARLDRFLRRIEREGVTVEPERGGGDSAVVAFRFRLPEAA